MTSDAATKAAPMRLPAPGAEDVLYLIDLSNYVFRAYHALPPMNAPTGEPTNATYGTLNMLNKLVNELRPAHLAVAMDSPGRGFRAAIDPRYKATRPAAPEDLRPQLERCREIVDAYNIPTFSCPGYEADDLIATLTQRARAADLRVVIASSDKDLMQLVDDERVLLWDAMRDHVYGPAQVHEKFGVRPEKVRELLALVGDTSDNIPGVPGVGPKTAAKLIEQFGSIDAMFARLDEVERPKMRELLREHEPAVRRASQLVELRTDAPVAFDREHLRWGGADVERLRTIFKTLEFTRFIEMLALGATVRPRKEALLSYRTLDLAALGALCERARQTRELAVTAFGALPDGMRAPLVGLALAAEPGGAGYLPIAHRYLGVPPQPPLAAVRELLAPILADETIGKVGHDLKQSAVILARHGMPLRGVRFDSMLASYLLDPEGTHKLGLIAQRDAGLRWLDFEEIAPKQRGRAQLTIEEIDVEHATTFGGEHAEAALRLARSYRDSLRQGELEKLLDEIELPLSDVLTRMEQTGVLVDPKMLAAMSVELARELERLEQEAYRAAGHELNLASPKQLETVLFDELGLRAAKKTKTGRSTDFEALEAIAADHPLPALVLEHRTVSKLKGTYADALPKLIHPETGRIHGRWEQAVAATGRLSSKDPNLQNIPIRTAHGKRIREAFVAPPGMLLLSADYSQIELRVLAHLSHDPKLCEAFTTGQDVHVRTAMEVFGVEAKDVTSAMRSQMKTVNFGVIYGMGAVALGKELGIPRADAKRFIDAYFERYRGVFELMEQTLERARKSEEVRTLLGRRRLIPQLHSKNHAERSYAERTAQNTPIQGTAADLLKLAMVRLGASELVPGARMVLTVHDELVFEVPEARIDEAAQRTREVMEGIYPLDVPLVVDVGWGKSWAAAH